MSFTTRLQILLPIAAFIVICQCGEITQAQVGNYRWQARLPKHAVMVADVKARQRGDQLVVNINQQSQVRNDARRQLDKQGTSRLEADGNFGFNGVLGSATGGASVDEQSNSRRQFQGNARQEIIQLFSDQFAVTVIDAKPNGNLLVEGRRKLRIEGDERELVLSGILRSVDILPNNTISSDKISNLSMRFETTIDGQEKSFNNQGWFGRKMNKIWGF